MQIEIGARALRAAVACVKGAVDKGKQIAILSHLLIEAKGDSITIRGTDLNREVVVEVGAKVIAPGSICADANSFYTIIAKLPAEAVVSIAVNPETKRTKLKCGRSQIVLPTLPPEDFPSFAVIKPTGAFSLKSQDFYTILRRVEFAIGKTDQRPALTGVLLTKNDNQLRAVATDGHRLSMAECDLPAGAESIVDIIIPHTTVSQLLSVLKDDYDDVTISVASNLIEINVGNITIRSKLVDSVYPNYRAVLPVNDKIVLVNAESFTDAVERVSALHSQERPAIAFKFLHGLVQMKVTNDKGVAFDEVEASYIGDETIIGLSARFTHDTLKNVEADQIEIRVGGQTTPTVFCVPEDSSWLALVMPMRV